MDALVQFLRDRLDDDERAARAATPGPWKVDDETFTESVGASDGVSVISGSRYGGGAPPVDTEDALHIARHDPARVLREVEAKRRIVDEIVPAMNGMDDRIDGEWGVGAMDPSEYESVDLLKLLALPYADHADYRDDWRP